MITLRISLPFQTLVNEQIQKITIESVDGFHTLLPKHIDYATALKTSIVHYVNQEGNACYVACDEGILIKKGKNISLSTRLGIKSNNLKELKEIIKTTFKKMEEERKETNKTLAKLELTLARGLLELNKGENR